MNENVTLECYSGSLLVDVYYYAALCSSERCCCRSAPFTASDAKEGMRMSGCVTTFKRFALYKSSARNKENSSEQL